MPTALLNSAGNDLPKAAGGGLDCAYPWLPDRGDGTYGNPIICADYSDPDVIRVSDDFYLVASSMNCTPGLPLLHSRDLVNWTLIGHAVKNVPHARYESVQPGCGIWAPAMQFHAGRFWLFFCTPDEGIFVVTAEHPAGQWSAPHLVQEGRGLIDPCPLWDDDGKAYLVHAYAGSRAGIKHRLRVRPMATDGTRLLGEGTVVFHDPERHPTLEGPKFLKRDGWYYLLAPAGGVETGWQVALRSRNIYGPYEDKIVLAQGNTDINGPHQGALVDTPEGGWWFLHFQDAGLYGRISHLQPVHWKDGWPLMGDHCQPVRRHAKPLILPAQKVCAPQTSDEFDGGALGLQWQWNANHREDWYSLVARPGWLRLYPQPAVCPPAGQPNLLLQKFPASTFLAETALELSAHQEGEEAGLVVTGGTQARLGLQFDGKGKRRVVWHIDGMARPQVLAEIHTASLRLRVEVRKGGQCSFAHAEGDCFVPVPDLFQAKKGDWIGARLGVYGIKKIQNSIAGHADVDYFRFA